jgi:hypothetical protein
MNSRSLMNSPAPSATTTIGIARVGGRRQDRPGTIGQPRELKPQLRQGMLLVSSLAGTAHHLPGSTGLTRFTGAIRLVMA